MLVSGRVSRASKREVLGPDEPLPRLQQVQDESPGAEPIVPPPALLPEPKVEVEAVHIGNDALPGICRGTVDSLVCDRYDSLVHPAGDSIAGPTPRKGRFFFPMIRATWQGGITKKTCTEALEELLSHRGLGIYRVPQVPVSPVLPQPVVEVDQHSLVLRRLNCGQKVAVARDDHGASDLVFGRQEGEPVRLLGAGGRALVGKAML